MVKKEIKELWAFIALNDGTGNEGIVSAQIGPSHMPLVAGSEKMRNMLAQVAKEIVKQSGTKIEIRKFSGYVVEETLGK